MSQVVVVIGGADLAALAVERVGDGATVIAADSGLDHAVAAGLRPALLVGDLDSISASGRMWAYAHETEVQEHPVDKDASDTELAIAAALRVPGVQQLLVLAGDGDRLDHMLGTILALGHPSLSELARVGAILGTTELVIILVIVLVLFGPKRLPQLGKSLGKTMKSLREGLDGKDDEDEQAAAAKAETPSKPKATDASEDDSTEE